MQRRIERPPGAEPQGGSRFAFRVTLSTWDFASATRNRLLAQTESVAGTTTRSWAYGYDPADRLTQALASPDGTYAYSLDPADNLLGIQTPTGTASSTVNTLNQIVQRSGQPLTHDAAGNLTGDGTRSYAWDAEQRLVRIGYTGTSRSTTFRYDAFGRRTAVIEQDGSTATETRYLWCGERICQARDGTDTVTRRYYAEGELAVAATGDVAGFYAEDHLGSIRDLRMGDGQVLASYDYDPYGNPTRVNETGGIHADYRYAGLVNHAQSALYLAHYRAYSPSYGRWISRDPIFEAGGVNLYAYSGENPINNIDPDGLTLRSNWDFFWDWTFGRGPRNRGYGPDAPETQEMSKGAGADMLRDLFYNGHCKNRDKVAYSSFHAFRDTIYLPWDTSFQVGGWAGATAVNNGNGTVTFTVPNTAGAHSFFYHAVPDRSASTGAMTNIRQIFQWSEKIDPSRCECE